MLSLRDRLGRCYSYSQREPTHRAILASPFWREEGKEGGGRRVPLVAAQLPALGTYGALILRSCLQRGT